MSADRPGRSRELWIAGLIATAAAIVANVVLWIVVQPVAGADLQVPTTPGGSELGPLPVLTVITATLFPSLIGALLLWALGRSGPAGVRRWTILAVVLGLLSCLQPFILDISTGRQLGLILFHLVALVVYVGVVRRRV